MIFDRLTSQASLAKLEDVISNVPSSKLITLSVLIIAVTALIIDYGYMLYLRSRMPPGPFPLPIIGNTFSLPDNKPWVWFDELSKRYNAPLVTIWIGRNPTVWICDSWCAHDMLEKKAQLYSSRPRMVVFGELGTGQANLVTMRTRNQAERDHWRVHRRLMHLGVGTQVVRRYRGVQDAESRVVALNMLRDPAAFVSHLERYATSVVSILAFGRRVASSSDPIITEVIAVMQLAAELNVPGKKFPMLMETFPILAKFPRSMPWMKGLGARGRKGGHYFWHSLAQEAVEQLDSRTDEERRNIPKPYVHTLFAENDKYKISTEEISNLTGNLFGAGSDTSASTLVTFVLACCAFPEPAHKAQRELDRVVGHGRSPSFGDQADLPYVNAFVKELLRWRPVAVIGGQPHSPTADDDYKGWHIPANSWVQGNLWAIHRNPRDFPDPDRFEPDRFVEGSEWQRPFPGDRGYMTFGWGRRVCSGQALAEQGVWITVARLLWAFDMRKKRDPVTGAEVPVDIFAFTNGLNMRPQPFLCDITPRSEEIRRTVESEGLDALVELKPLDGESRYRFSTYYQQKKRSLGREVT
ncbi:hypothetical protein PoMZ_08172 [Pyricularia oryzae]|uniref:Cytochrome P450 n=1 Tax=Pyricularia oryzae TaxID=318829 RepID=A0A4P7NGW5_PYROR|nr:hypothetical protein PoMZ_08172 [Pyricularia oryzae]